MKDEIPIHFLRRTEIDIQKWDRCISEAANGLIYARAFYLDQMAKQWDGLVMGNYEAVMPLTSNRKWSVSYLYQPPFVQQLGIFSRNKPDQYLIDLFISATKKRFQFAEIFLNSQNPFDGALACDNFILNLALPYPAIRSNYKEDLIKNLKRVKKFKLLYADSNDFPGAIRSFRQTYGPRIPHVKPKDYQHFSSLCQFASENNMLLLREVRSGNQEILAIALLLKDNHRVYNILSTTSPKGRRCGANHFLFEELIKELAGSEMVLDFEGSSIPGIAKFYQKFGAVKEPYFFLRYNNLSQVLKWMKK